MKIPHIDYQIAPAEVHMAALHSTRSNIGFYIFRDYEDGKYIYEDQLESLIDYLVGNVSSYYSPNRSYYQDWYNECNNLQMVIRWRKNHGFGEGLGKYGERVCYKFFTNDGEVIDLTKPKFKDHAKDCTCNKLDAIKLRHD